MSTHGARAASALGLGGPLAKGLLFGAIAGVIWVASRKGSSAPPALIDWDRVGATARTVGDQELDWDAPPATVAEGQAERYAAWVRQSADLIGRYVREDVVAHDDSVFAFNRRQWIEANLNGFRILFEPLERINREILHDGTIGSVVMGGAGRMVLSSELGILVGYLSRRVLGQYDLALLGREPLTNGVGGRLYFVEPNIARLQARLDFDPEEFRLWIALHETTHAYEFENHPWVRDYMNSMLGRYFDSLSDDLLGIRKSPTGALDFVQRVGGNLFRSGSPIDAVMNAEQRAIFGQLQALMCLLEGYSNHVMDQVGSQLLPSYPTMKARFDERNKNRSFAERLFARLTGLDVKQEQYVLGERFVSEVVRRRGIDFVNRAWGGPSSLPTMAEIRDPAAWIARLGG
jgi:coenzyme F420 biosynthesis associated uncharacterized protein